MDSDNNEYQIMIQNDEINEERIKNICQEIEKINYFALPEKNDFNNNLNIANQWIEECEKSKELEIIEEYAKNLIIASSSFLAIILTIFAIVATITSVMIPKDNLICGFIILGIIIFAAIWLLFIMYKRIFRARIVCLCCMMKKEEKE